MPRTRGRTNYADNDIATAPIKETKRATHQPAVITGRPLAYVATAGTVTIRDRRLSLLSA